MANIIPGMARAVQARRDRPYSLMLTLALFLTLFCLLFGKKLLLVLLENLKYDF